MQPVMQEQEGLIVLDFEKAYKEKRYLNVSEVADTVEYLVLHTPRDNIVTGIRRIVFFENYLYVSTRRSEVFLFSKIC